MAGTLKIGLVFTLACFFPKTSDKETLMNATLSQHNNFIHIFLLKTFWNKLIYPLVENPLIIAKALNSLPVIVVCRNVSKIFH